METSLKALIEEQSKKVTDSCIANSLNIDRNAKSISELNDLIMGLSLQVTKLAADKTNQISEKENATPLQIMDTPDKPPHYHAEP